MRKNISVFLTFSILAVFVSMISTVSAHTPTPTKSPTPTKTPSPTKTPKPTESPKPTHTPKPTPAQSEPPYPACTNGTVVKTFGRFTSKDNHENKEKTIKFTLPSTFVPRNGTVIVLQGEGHAWDKGYPVLSGPKSAITGFPSNAKEFQPKEIAAFSAGQDKNALSPIGTFIDHSPGAGTLSTDQDNITTSYTFAFGTLKPGKNYLKVRHIDTGHEDESDSVFVKGVICADPEPTKVPTDLTNTPTMTPTETPVASESATPTLSPTPTVTEEPTETPEPTETLEPTETETPTPTETVVPTSTTAPTDTLTPTLTPSITLTPTPTPIACIEGPVWTAGVVSSTQGVKKDGTPVAFDRSNPYTVEGPADSVFFTLGGHGQITTIFDRKIQNLPGNDFTVYEFTFGHLSYPEEDAKVEVSDDGITWFTLPTQVRSNINALGLNSMDFSSTGLSTIQYIRITDQTNFALNTVDGILGGNADGIDIDAIQGLKQVCQ